uniref:cytochrome c oxidase subunit 2 n=1 Tax=Allocreadium lobatum TaxID=334451 RepID=UPI00300112B2|nr:cytochrome c oxidase subunit 2 [Allocreadium lobatum]
MLIFQGIYLVLFEYMYILCCFIPLWVLMVLGWQVFTVSGVSEMNNESKLLELFWTMMPTFSVMLLCYFNLRCMQGYDKLPVKDIIKIVGRQWYWSYETPSESMYDSMMLDFMNSVDKPLCLDFKSTYMFLMTSSDVIHSFAMPQFHLKSDAMPGRVNDLYFSPDRMGVFVGYCSELCGAGHAYMPMVVEISDFNKSFAV